MADENKVEEIHRREARSGKVSYGDSVVIHESTKTRVVLVPFYVPRSEGNDLAVKITTYQKTPPPSDWAIVETKSVSLNEAAAFKLLGALKTHLAIADQESEGDYIVIRVQEGTAQFGDIDPAAVTGAITQVLSRPEIAKHLATTVLSDELVGAFRGVIRLQEMRSAVATLRTHLEQGEGREQIYQDWCKAHSWAFGNAYVMSDDVREISPGDHLDLLMPTVISGYRDIVELKRPDVDVLLYDSTHRNYYFSSEVSKAVGQVHRYMDVLHEVATAGLRDHPELIAYHPRSIVVVGRSAGWPQDKLRALHGLNHRLNGITVMTYDQLLGQGERLIEMLGSEQTELFRESEPEFSVFDDDFPF